MDSLLIILIIKRLLISLNIAIIWFLFKNRLEKETVGENSDKIKVLNN